MLPVLFKLLNGRRCMRVHVSTFTRLPFYLSTFLPTMNVNCVPKHGHIQNTRIACIGFIGLDVTPSIWHITGAFWVVLGRSTFKFPGVRVRKGRQKHIHIINCDGLGLLGVIGLASVVGYINTLLLFRCNGRSSSTLFSMLNFRFNSFRSRSLDPLHSPSSLLPPQHPLLRPHREYYPLHRRVPLSPPSQVPEENSARPAHLHWKCTTPPFPLPAHLSIPSHLSLPPPP